MSYDSWKCTPPPDDPTSVCSCCGAVDDGNPLLVEQWPEAS